MTEIQCLLTETIDDLNIREKRDNKPRFDISFIHKHPELFIGMYVAWFVILAVMLQLGTLVDSIWLPVMLFAVLNGFFFFDVASQYRFENIDVLDFRVCYSGEWCSTRFVPSSLIDTIPHSPPVDSEHRAQLQKMIPCKGEFSLYGAFTLTRAQTNQ